MFWQFTSIAGICVPATAIRFGDEILFLHRGISTNWELFYLRPINPMIEKINPTIPIPITGSSIPDEQEEIKIAKSNIAIPNPIFFIVSPSFITSNLCYETWCFANARREKTVPIPKKSSAAGIAHIAYSIPLPICSTDRSEIASTW